MLKLHIVQALFGDSFILEYGTPRRRRFLLIDGGPDGVYRNFLRPALQDSGAARRGLDLVVLSHVDEDHIAGLLDLFAELDAQRQAGQKALLKIKGLWHNTFSTVEQEAASARSRRLPSPSSPAAGRTPSGDGDSAAPSGGGDSPLDRELRSIAQGDELTHLAAALDIPLNPNFPPGAALLAAPDDPIRLGNLTLTLFGPTQKNLDRLQADWQAWLDKRKKALEAGDQRSLRALDQSVPNLSSLMFLAEAHGKTILFTGDGRGDHLLQALRAAGRLPKKGGQFPVDVLKLPHHGSIRNVPRQFFESVPASQYIISADGRHGNPDPKTLLALADALRKHPRPVEILATNRTATTEAFEETFPPEQFACAWRYLPTGRTFFTLDLA